MPQTGEDHCNDGKPIKAPTSHLRFPPANFIFLPPQFHRERYCFFVCHGDLLLPQSADWLANHTTQARREPFVLVSRLGDGFPRRITCIFRSSIRFWAGSTLSGTTVPGGFTPASVDTCGFSPLPLGPPARLPASRDRRSPSGCGPVAPALAWPIRPQPIREDVPAGNHLQGSRRKSLRCARRPQSLAATREWRLPANFQPSSALVTTLHCVAIFQRAFGIGVGSKR